MKMNNAAQELLKRYLLAIKRDLGTQQGEDITAEIESYIGDLLEERFGGDTEVGAEELEAVLKEMGSPRKVAAQYRPQRYLIGPRLFPIYWLVLRILAAVVAGSLALSFFISIGLRQEGVPTQAFLEFLGSIFSGVLSGAGSVTLVFAIMERLMENREVQELKDLEEFKLSELPELPQDEQAFHPVGSSFEIVLGALGIAFFTYLRITGGALPIYANPSEKIGMGSIFTENFLQFIPVILVLAGLEIGRNVTLLAQGRRSALTSWWAIAGKGANLILNGFMISALPLITLDLFRRIPGLNPSAQADQIANSILAILLGLSILGGVVDIIRSTLRELRNPTY